MNFEDFHREIEKIRSHTMRLRLGIAIVRALVVAAILGSLWTILAPGHWAEQVLIFVLSLVLALAVARMRKLQPLTHNHLLAALEVKKIKREPKELLSLEREVDEFRTTARRDSMSYASTLVPLILVMLIQSLAFPSGVGNAFSLARQAVQQFALTGIVLTVQSGKSDVNAASHYELSSANAPTIELFSENLIEIKVIQPESKLDAPLSLELRNDSTQANAFYQSFQFSPPDRTKNDSSSAFVLNFTASESVDLYIPQISSRMLARLKVKNLPIPKVFLISHDLQQRSKPWPDDQPLPLDITVTAENPLEQIRLVISGDGRKSTENVMNIMATDIREYSTQYELNLSSYLEGDVGELDIFAEAVDRSLPQSLVGRSEPIRVKVMSAYGRYQQALQTLKKLKALLDQTETSTASEKIKELATTATLAESESEDSPYFDAMDRAVIQNIASDLGELTETGVDEERLSELSEHLNEFLFEHQTLDARERDRDFFIAVRTLSRLVEQEKNERQITITKVTGKISKFLDERHKLWALRVSMLHTPPPEWASIQSRKPFHAGILRANRLETKDDPASKSEVLAELSRTSLNYRTWIEVLEKAEDQFRQEQESKRQQGLASAREELKELQQRQDEISLSLDRADAREAQELEDAWQTTRTKQNANLNASQKLEGNLRAFSPGAAKRIKFAMKNMNDAIQAGNEHKFGAAETAADMAGRFLRLAESDAQKSQNGSPQRGRRRRVTNDQSFGQDIVGGDIELKHDYKVDRRYRDQILDEVRQQSSHEDEDTSSPEDQKILQQYLRDILR